MRNLAQFLLWNECVIPIKDNAVSRVSRKDVKVKVEHILQASLAIGLHQIQPLTFGNIPNAPCNFGSGLKDRASQFVSQIIYRFNMLTRDNQNFIWVGLF